MTISEKRMLLITGLEFIATNLILYLMHGV